MESRPPGDDPVYVRGDGIEASVHIVTENVRRLAGEHWAAEQYQHLESLDRRRREFVNEWPQGSSAEDQSATQRQGVVLRGTRGVTERQAGARSPYQPDLEASPASPWYISHRLSKLVLSDYYVPIPRTQNAYDRDVLRNLLSLLPPSWHPQDARQILEQQGAPSRLYESPQESSNLHPIAASPVQLDSSGPPVTCTFGIMNRSEKLSFISQDFRPNAYGDLKFGGALNGKISNSMGLVFVIITNWQPWFLMDLTTAIPSFPPQPVLHLSNDKATTMLPLVNRDLCEMTCIMEHIDITAGKDDNTHNLLQVGSMRISSMPLVVWSAATSALEGYPQRPLVVIVCSSAGNVVSKIANHYIHVSRRVVRHERWNRLKANQTWLYVDLYFLFTHWENVWGTVKQNLHLQTQEVLGPRNQLSIIDRTRQLHTDNNVMISLREHLRIHRASLKRVIQRTKEDSDSQSRWQSSHVLKNRLDDAAELLEYFDVTATSLLEHQHNLLSLAFNLETVIQGQAVARLNALAFVFLPLSFVAGIFGITTFTALPYWYPVAAVPTLILTIGIAYLSNWLFNVRNQPNSGILPETDIEDPTVLKSTAMSDRWTRRTLGIWKLSQQNLSQFLFSTSTAPSLSPPTALSLPRQGYDRPSHSSLAQMIPTARPPPAVKKNKRILNFVDARFRSNPPSSTHNEMNTTSHQTASGVGVESNIVDSTNSMMAMIPRADDIRNDPTPLSAASPYVVIPRAGVHEQPQITAPPPTQLTRRSNTLVSAATAINQTAQSPMYTPAVARENANFSYVTGYPPPEPEQNTMIESPVVFEDLTTDSTPQSQSAGEVRIVATEIGEVEGVPILETIPE